MRSTRRIAFFALFAAFVAVAPALSAQAGDNPRTARAESALAIPSDGDAHCRIVPLHEFDPDPRRDDLIVREFHYGEPSPGLFGRRAREILLTTDRAGRPVLLISEVYRYSAEDVPLGSEQAIADFLGEGSMSGVVSRVDVDTAAMAAAAAAGDVQSANRALRPQPPRELTAADQRRVRALVAHLWERRCEP